MRITLLPLLLPVLLLAACAGGAPPPQASAPPVHPSRSVPARPPGLDRVIGKPAAALVALFGKPDLDFREGEARKLQFRSPVCVLDAYLYPPATAQEPVVRHVDARTPAGEDIDRASCIAGLSRRLQAR